MEKIEILEERIKLDIETQKQTLKASIKFLKIICNRIEIHINQEMPSLNSLGEIQGLGNSIDVSVSKLQTLIYLKKEILDKDN